MSRFSRPVRLPFQPGGFMVCNKPGPINGVEYAQGEVIPPEALASMNDRKLQVLWEAKRLEMASAEQIAAYQGGEPVTLTVDGGPDGGQPADPVEPETEPVDPAEPEAEEVEEPEEPVDPAEQPQLDGPVAPEGQEVSFHKGFGKWFIYNDKGERVDGPMNKEAALARAPEYGKA